MVSKCFLSFRKGIKLKFKKNIFSVFFIYISDFHIHFNTKFLLYFCIKIQLLYHF